jgi:hypothetical protein
MKVRLTEKVSKVNTEPLEYVDLAPVVEASRERLDAESAPGTGIVASQEGTIGVWW